MFNKKYRYLMSTVTVKALIVGLATISTVWAEDHIVPSMVNIPAGQFMMGAEDGHPDTKPIHSESIAAFQMGEYAETVAEYRKFAEDTGFNPESTCGDFLR